MTNAWMVWGIAAVLCVGGCSKKNANRELFERVAATLPAEIAAARKEGLLIDANDLKRKSPIADADNAAPLYRKLPSTIDFGAMKTEYRAFCKDNNRIHLSTIESLLARHKDVFKLVDQACQKKHCDFNRNWTSGMDTQFPEFEAIELAVRLVRYRGLCEANRGEYQAAQKTINQSIRMANHLAEEPGIAAMYTELSLRMMTQYWVREILEQGKGKPEMVALASETLRQIPARTSLRKRWIDEGAYICISLRRKSYAYTSKSEMKTISQKMSRDVPEDEGYFYKSLMATKDVSREVIQNAYLARWLESQRKCLPYVDDAQDPRLVEAQVRKVFSDLKSSNDPTGVAAVYVVPGRKSGLAFIRYQTRYAILQAAIHVFEIKNKTGKYPATISELDPCDGQPLGYELLSKGFIILTRGAAPETPKGCDPIAPLTDEERSKLDFTYRG